MFTYFSNYDYSFLRQTRFLFETMFLSEFLDILSLYMLLSFVKRVLVKCQKKGFL